MKKLKYIESRGGQYIDTGYIVKKNTRLVMRCNVQEEYRWSAPFGVRAGASNQAFQYCARDNSAQVGVICFGTFSEIKIPQPSSVYNNDIEISLSNNLFTIKSVLNGEVLVNHPFTQSGALSETLSLYFFTLNQGGRDIGNICWTNMKLYGCEIYEDETLVKSYLPMLDDSMVPCLYESVNKETFYNAGSGSFTYEVASTEKYLVRDGSAIYTVTDNALVELTGELNSELFISSGVDTIPDGALLLPLNAPEVLCWTDAETLPTLTATVTATPPPQNVISKRIDLSHDSITGIENMIAECEGELICAVSFDDKQTWKAWNGEVWATLTEDFTGMSKETLEGITFEQWNELYSGADSLYIRISLVDTTQSVTEIVVDFSN